jgi:N-hydroxyarylamine O-acetyltransferase
MRTDLDLSAYLDRIEWGGTTAPTFDTLAGLLRAHVERIPFENLDVLLGRGVRLDLPSLQDKLVRRRRGGYCFEHATLFAAVLEALGFAPARHTARVVMVLPRDQAPRAHMLLTVALREGRFILDPGFGGLAPRVPVPLEADHVVGVAGDVHWMTRDGDHWMLRARAAGKDGDCWVSTLEHDNLVDFEVGNHFTATHPGSPFVNRLMLRAYTPRGRVHVMNRDVTEWRDGAAHTRTLQDRAALRDLLAESFGIDLPEVAALRVPMVPDWQ